MTTINHLTDAINTTTTITTTIHLTTHYPPLLDRPNLHVSRFDGGNDEWISTISQAFEGFSDFKKIDGGQETDLK